MADADCSAAGPTDGADGHTAAGGESATAADGPPALSGAIRLDIAAVLIATEPAGSRASQQSATVAEAVARLEQNTAVTMRFYAGCSKLSGADLSGLWAVLQHNTSLVELDLCNCGSVSVAEAAQLGKALRGNATLAKLRLSGADLNAAAVERIARALKHNAVLQALDLSGNVRLGDDGAVALAEALKSSRSMLGTLNLTRCRIGVAGLNAIGDALVTNSTLSTLILARNRITERGVAQLRTGLARNKALDALDLSINSIGDAGAARLMKALETNASLHKLTLWDNKIGDAGAAAIAESLKRNISLHVLHLGSNTICADGAAAIGAALGHNTSLRTLILERNAIGDSGAAAIGAGLKCNAVLSNVHLGANEIGDRGAMAMAEALEHSKSLRTLSLESIAICDAGMAAIGAALEHNTALCRLDLKFNKNIRAVGVDFLNTRRLGGSRMGGNREPLGLNFDFANLTWPPPSVSKQGRDAVYSFLEAVKRKSAPLTRSRIMLVGVGGSGKTTLKTALLLRGTGARDVLPKLLDHIVETIEARWSESDLRGWVDDDLACRPGFYDSLDRSRTQGLTGKEWLRLTPADVDRIFGGDGSPLARRVVERMIAVLCFLKPDASRAAAHNPAWAKEWWMGPLREALSRNAAVRDRLHRVIRKLSGGRVNLGAGDAAEHEAPYAALLDIPHVWTEGIVLDELWENFTLWDFPGQMELYPSQRLFLACETAVYVLVVNGRCGTVGGCMSQLSRWLSLIRSAMVEGGTKIVARIVITHTDPLTPGERASLLREVHDLAVHTFREHFDFGAGPCYATVYTEPGAGGVDALRDELVALRKAEVPQRPLPAIYQDVCRELLEMARERPRWPVVPLCEVDTQGEIGVLPCLEDLGFLRRAGDLAVLEPVTWLSHLMAAFLHPYHGVGRIAAVPAETLPEHLDSVTLSTDDACRLVNMRGTVVGVAERNDVLPLLSQFDICFSLDTAGEAAGAGGDKRYVFPALLPPVESVPPWVEGAFAADTPLEARRYVCIRREDVVPSTLASMLVARVAYMCPDLKGLTPVLLGRGTVVVSCGARGTVGVRLTSDDRAIDVFALGELRQPLLSAATVHLAVVVGENYPGLQLLKQRLSRVTKGAQVDPTAMGMDHPLLSQCRVDAVETSVSKDIDAALAGSEQPSATVVECDREGVHLPLVTPHWLFAEVKRNLPGDFRWAFLTATFDGKSCSVRTGAAPQSQWREGWQLICAPRVLVETTADGSRLGSDDTDPAASLARSDGAPMSPLSPRLSLEQANWIKGSMLTVDVFSDGLRTVFTREFERLVGVPWRDEPDFGRFVVYGGGPPGTFTDDVVPLGGATAAAAGERPSVVLVGDVDLTGRLEEGDLVCVFDGNGSEFFFRLAKEPSKPVMRPDGTLVPGKITLDIAGARRVFPGANVPCGVRASTELGLGVPGIANARDGGRMTGPPAASLPRIASGDRQSWDLTALRLLLIGSRIAGAGDALLPIKAGGRPETASAVIERGWADGTHGAGDLVAHIVQAYRNDVFAHSGRQRLPDDADPPEFPNGFNDLVRMMRLFADECVGEAEFAEKIKDVVDIDGAGWSHKLLRSFSGLERKFEEMKEDLAHVKRMISPSDSL